MKRPREASREEAAERATSPYAESRRGRRARGEATLTTKHRDLGAKLPPCSHPDGGDSGDARAYVSTERNMAAARAEANRSGAHARKRTDGGDRHHIIKPAIKAACDDPSDREAGGESRLARRRRESTGNASKSHLKGKANLRRENRRGGGRTA